MSKTEFNYPVSRRTLAMHYFKSPTYDSAVKKMNRWLKWDNDLRNDLIAAGCFPKQRKFNKKQAEVFRKYLG